MNTEFLVIDDSASKAIVQATVLQSIEFSAGAQLAEVIKRERDDLDILKPFHVVHSGGGIFLINPEQSAHYMVIDFSVVDPFSGSQYEALIIFQRLLRFAIRRWTGRRPSHADHHIQKSTKFVIFPFSIGTQSKYRIAIETSPDPKRVAKRFPGHHLLVYQDGWNEGFGPSFQPEKRVFRLAFDGLRQAQDALRDIQPGDAQTLNTDALRVCALSKREASPISPHVGFEKWMSLLTRPQLDFVTRFPRSAERIEGPAGTGKTLSLVLKCIHALRTAEEENLDFHAAFFAHSEATRGTIEVVFHANCPDLDRFLGARLQQRQTLNITTLQMWCAERLGRETVSETQFLDQDALASKEYRRLIIEDCLRDAMTQDYPTHQPFLSAPFKEFLENEDNETVADLVQHEIAVMIKGRAGENIDVYRKLPPVKYALPCTTAADRSFVFVVYDRYANVLMDSGEYDTDDVVLTALASLENPIWRRKRLAEGYDAIFVDETHLFNLNELSVFHHLTRAPDRARIAFSIDRAQAPGDRGLTRALIDRTMLDNMQGVDGTNLKSIFRSSKEIVALATSVTASGAGLFVGFDDPLEGTEAIVTDSDEDVSATPVLRKFPSDESVCTEALNRAGQLAKELQCSPSEILIVTFSVDLLRLLEETAEGANKAIEVIEHRGDIKQIRKANKHSRFVVALPEFVGGLEFYAVLLVGVDEGRVPPTPVTAGNQSRHFLSFRSHNHLYVAITRARYRIEVLVNSARGVSKVFAGALADGLLRES